MNGPVNMFVAAALDETTTGDVADAVNEPLYVNVLAPDNDTAAVLPAVNGPTMFIIDGEETASPTAMLPVMDPDILMFVADTTAPMLVFDVVPPVIEPVTSRLVPVKSNVYSGCADPAGPTIFPTTFRFPPVTTTVLVADELD